MMVFDHVGLLVDDIDRGLHQLSGMLPLIERTERFDDPGLTVSVMFLRDADGVTFELIAPFGENSVISTSLRKRSSIINQLAYKSQDLEADRAHLLGQGCIAVSAAREAVAFAGGVVQFFYAPQGFLIELIDAPHHNHQFRAIRRTQ